jgi:NAD(P)H-flavin reductase
VLRSISHRRANFGKIALVYGARYPQDLAFLKETEDWQKSGVEVILTLSRPEGTEWKGKKGHVHTHYKEVMKDLSKPLVLLCGMKAMMEESRAELALLGIEESEILTNY